MYTTFTAVTPKTSSLLLKVSDSSFNLIKFNIALNKHIPNEEDGGGGEEKVLVLISSLMAWDATPRKLEKLIQPGTEDPEELAEAEAAAKVVLSEGAEGEEGEEEGEKEEPEPEKEPSVQAPEEPVEGEEGEEGEK